MNIKDLKQLFRDISIKESKNNNIEVNFIVKELDENVNSFTEDNIIFFNKKSIDNMIINDDIENRLNIYNLIKSFYHEIKHIIQIRDTNDGIISNSTMFYITCNLINEYYDSNDYRRNYCYQELEIDANIFGYTKLRELLISIDENKYSKIINNIDIKINEFNNYLLYNQRINKDNKKEPIYIYLPRVMDSIIKKHSDILHKYSQISLFYFNDGKSKSIIEIVKDKRIISLYDTNDIFFEQMLLDKILNIRLEDTNKEFFGLFRVFLKYFIVHIENTTLDNKDTKYILDYKKNCIEKIIEICRYNKELFKYISLLEKYREVN